MNSYLDSWMIKDLPHNQFNDKGYDYLKLSLFLMDSYYVAATGMRVSAEK